MSGLLQSLQGAVSQGVLWGIMVLGVYITYKILNIADLTVDGSFALGGCVSAILISTFGWNPLLALIVATLSGVLAGAVTGFLHTVFEIPAILAGILTQIALWSINLRIMGGKANIPLLNYQTIFTWLMDKTGLSPQQVGVILGVIIAVLVIILLYWFFGTELGAALRATGDNEDMIRALGVDIRWTKVLALMVSNGLVALSGGLVSQSQKTATIDKGAGAIVIGLASIVIGGVLMGKLRSFGSKLTSTIVGTIVYFLITAIVLRLGMKANDMKLLSAIIVALALFIPVASQKWAAKRAYSKGGKA